MPCVFCHLTGCHVEVLAVKSCTLDFPEVISSVFIALYSFLLLNVLMY